MNIALVFTRIFFLILSVFFMTLYMVSMPTGNITFNALIGVSIGIIFSALLMGFDTLFRRYNLRSFNIAIIGLFIGYLMGQALVLIFNGIVNISALSVHLNGQFIEIIHIALFLFGTYLGTIMTLRASDEIYVSIPFVKFTPTAQKKKDILIDASVLSDTRIVDLASSGLIDHHLIVPRFVMRDLYAQAEGIDELSKEKAKRSLESLKKLEEIPEFTIRFNDTDFPEIADQQSKLIRLARLLESNILTADITRIQVPTIEGIRIINLNGLSKALKPIMETGEILKIKIQRYGKEPRQGVGYLEDGTMVVVNGGGEFIGEIIEVIVLSVKHTASGRMVFCNVLDENQNKDNIDNNNYDEY
jgi:uncharacterized protein YacL